MMRAHWSQTWFTVAAALLLLCTEPASGVGAQRTFVKSDGLDTNPCSLAAPCRSFAIAIAATTPGGEVIVLDSAGYGPVTITQSVSIIAPDGVYAGVSVPSDDGITIDGSGIQVALEGLTINGTGSTANGINFIQGSALRIAKCSIANMGGGLWAHAPNAHVQVTDTEFHNNLPGGSIGLAGPLWAILDGVHATAGSVNVQENVDVSIRNSEFAQLFAYAHLGGLIRVTIENSYFAGGDGIVVRAYPYTPATASFVTLDVVRTTVKGATTMSTVGDGIVVLADDLSPLPSVAIATVTDSVITDNAGCGISVGEKAVALATGNVIARNGSCGMRTFNAGPVVLHTRGNNSGPQVIPVQGNVVPIAGF
jgi:hypothetical protein